MKLSFFNGFAVMFIMGWVSQRRCYSGRVLRCVFTLWRDNLLCGRVCDGRLLCRALRCVFALWSDNLVEELFGVYFALLSDNLLCGRA